jgi:hypothetical protein
MLAWATLPGSVLAGKFQNLNVVLIVFEFWRETRGVVSSQAVLFLAGKF